MSMAARAPSRDTGPMGGSDAAKTDAMFPDSNTVSPRRLCLLAGTDPCKFVARNTGLPLEEACRPA